MSDDFSTCNNCGAHNEGFTNMEQLKTQMLETIYNQCIDNPTKKFKDIEAELEESILEYNKICDAEDDGEDGICSSCGEYATVSTQHVDYHDI